MTEERWKPVVGFEGLYEVSDQGRVRSPKGIRSANILKTGYHVYQLYGTGKPKTRLVSRMVLEAFVGAPPSDKHQAAHNDGNNTDNQLSNLRWATARENNADKKLHGTEHYTVGEASSRSILTRFSIDRIRDLRRAGCTHKQISVWIGTCLSNVCYILQGRTWSHV